MRIVLTGFMGVGKTVVGRELAERLDLPFFDLDELIEMAAESSVGEIFETRGEDAFRRYEQIAFDRVLELPRAVIATGGGTLVREVNARSARGRATTVWLNASPEVIERRLDSAGREERPLWSGPAAMRELLQERLPAYRRADLQLDIEAEESVGDIVERLVDLLEEARCATS